MRNSNFCLFSVVSLLSAGKVIAQPVATEFNWPVSPLTAYNNNDNPFLAVNKGKYHMGEDWNGNGKGSTDYGDPVYPMAVGKVVKASDQKGSVGKVVVVKHLLPNGQLVYSYYFHLSKILVNLNQIVYPDKPLGQIGDANGYYAGAAHLHLELRRVNQSMSSSYYPTLTIATVRKYFDPSLFVNDRSRWISFGPGIGMITVNSDEAEITNYAPASLAYVFKDDQIFSLPMAIKSGWLGKIVRTRAIGASRWTSTPLESLIFSPGTDFQIEFKKSCFLFVFIPGHNFQASRARGDMIKAASRAGFTRVKLETFTDLGDDETLAFDLRSLCFDNGPNTGVGCLVQATEHDNPLLRYVIWYDPSTGMGIGDWIELDQNDID